MFLKFKSELSRGSNTNFAIGEDAINYDLDFNSCFEGDCSGPEAQGIGRINGTIVVSAEDFVEDEEGNETNYTNDEVAKVHFTAIDLDIFGFNFTGNTYDREGFSNVEEALSCLCNPILHYSNIFEEAYLRAVNSDKLSINLNEEMEYIDRTIKKPYVVVLDYIWTDVEWCNEGICSYILNNIFKLLREFANIPAVIVFGTISDNFKKLDEDEFDIITHCLDNANFELFEVEENKCFSKFVFDSEYDKKY